MLRALATRLWHSPTFTTWGSLVVRLGGALAVLPIVLVRFEPAEVALWQLLTTLFMLALMLDFGLAPTFARLLAYARGGASLARMRALRDGADPGAAGRDTAADEPAPGAPSSTPRVFATVRWLYPRMALGIGVVLAVGGTLALIHPTSQLQEQREAWWAWALTLVTTVVALWGGAWTAALQGLNRIAEMRRWEVGFGLLQVASCLVALALGAGLLGLVAAFQVWLPVAALRNRWLLKRRHPELFEPRPKRDDEVMRLMWPAAWRSGIGMLMSHGLIHASGVVYSQLAPAAEVAAYLLALRVIFMISQFSQAPFYSKLPRLAELHATGRHGEQIAFAQRGMRFAHWSYVAGVLLVALLAGPLLGAIGSQVQFVSPLVWACMATAFFAERYGAMHLQLYSVTNHIVWHVANGVTGLLTILLVVLLYPPAGVLALPLAMLLAYAGFYCVYSVGRSRRAFGFRLLSFERGVSIGPALAMGVGLAVAVGGWR